MFSIQKCQNVISVNFMGEKIFMPLDSPLEIQNIPIKRDVQIKDKINNEKISDFDAYSIYMTRKCNYACSYCFVDRNSKHTIVKSDDLIGFIKSRDKKRIQIRFFGGEPLLRIQEIKGWVDKLDTLLEEGYSVSYSIVTNGSLLDKDIIEYLYDKKFIAILSHELNDDLQRKNRIADEALQIKTIENIKNLTKTKMVHRSTIRCMLEPNSKVSILDRFKYAVDMGISYVQFDMPEVLSDSSHEFDDKAIEALKDQIEELAIFYLTKLKEQSFQYFGLHNIDGLLKIWILNDRYIDYDTCGFCINHFSVDVDGLIYPCQDFAGIDKFCIGDIYSGLNENFIDTSIENHMSCLKCSVQELCTKRCYYSNYIATNNIYMPSRAQCEMKKAFIAVAIYIMYKLKQDPELFNNYCTLLKVKNRFLR